jgi:hypothetical protein
MGGILEGRQPMKSLMIGSLAGLLLAGQASADTIAIVCGSPTQAGDTRIVFNTNGWARLEGHRYQARVTDNEIDFEVDRQPFEAIGYRIDRRTGTAYLTMFSYQSNRRSTAARACRKDGASEDVF